MQHPSTAALYAYWNRQRSGAPFPRRSAIAPGQIRGLLGDMFILQADSHAAFPFRLAGTRVCALFGRELTGHDFLSLWAGTDSRQIEDRLRSLRSEAAAFEIGLTCFNGRSQSVAAEMVLLPLSQDGQAIDRVLGLIAPLERPTWLGLHPVTRPTIASTVQIAREPATATGHAGAANAPASPLPGGDAESPLAGRPEVAGGGRPRLVVLEGGRR